PKSIIQKQTVILKYSYKLNNIMYMSELKKEFLELLEKDIEFRYAVAGYLGLSEILKRLDRLEEGQKKLWEAQNRLWESNNKLWEEVRGLREGQNRLWEEIRSLREGQNKLWEEVRSLREGQNKLWEGQNRLWEGQNRLWEEIRSLREDFRNMKKTLERITISEEEEASEVVSYRLEKEYDIKVKFQRIYVDDKEINLYAATEDTCIIGEVTTRLGTKLVNELEEKIQQIKKSKPELLKPKMIKLIYTIMATQEAIEKAKEYGIWVLNWKEDLTPPQTHQTT
ncbi:MAG: hypothetical protein QXT84_07535, partial [Candidatus Bathyarchaeia archaeon]